MCAWDNCAVKEIYSSHEKEYKTKRSDWQNKLLTKAILFQFQKRDNTWFLLLYLHHLSILASTYIIGSKFYKLNTTFLNDLWLLYVNIDVHNIIKHLQQQ